MIFYSWSALSGSKQTAGPPGPPVAMGVTDDRARAVKAGEEILRSGRAVVVVIEAVRPAMAARTLAPCYARTGVAWLGRRDSAGGVTWNRFFFPAGPEDHQALAGWAHEAPDLH